MTALNQDALFRTPNVYSWGNGFDLSPDGRSLVYMWNGSGHWELYLLPLGGGIPRQLTSGSDSKMFPRFSPDGTRVAYGQDYDGDECFDVHVLDLATGQVKNLMPDTPDEGLNEFLRWSPDGRWIYYASNRDQDFAIFGIAVEDGTVKRLSHHTASDVFVEPSPDGHWLAVQAMIDGQNHAIYLVPTNGGPEIRLGEELGLQDAELAEWSPDSRRLAFVSADRGMYDVVLYDLNTCTIEWLTPSDYEYYSPTWSPQADRLLYLVSREASCDLVLHDLKHGPEIIRILPGIHNQARFTPDGAALVLTYSGPAHPPDLWSLCLADRATTQLTDSLPPQIDRSIFVQPTHVWYPSLDPGVQVPALLYQPQSTVSAGPPPGVIYVHGGPTAQQDNDWYPAIQDFVTRGYVVLCPNYRGSTGYGKAFREANRFDLGRGDTNDVAAGADYLAREGLADPRRIAVTGISYGGFMTMTCTTQHPDKWAAGSALVPFVNWFTEHASEREDLQYWDAQNMGDPVKDYERWYQNSPIFFVERITAPIQLMAGGNDVRCPPAEAGQVRDKLLELGRPVEMYVYADEGHILRQLNHRVDAYQKRAAFIDRYLKA
ncbi:acylaminoacyl-peptidase [Thermoflexales bacterium]|nr:acylaminoacyl-peptidase [Thermoflexales bacterium]